MVYVVEDEGYAPNDVIPAGAHTLHLSGTEQRRLLSQGQRLPSWFTPPKVAEELYRQHPPRSRQGFVVFLTGLPGAGKSTVANVLVIKLLEFGGRRVTLLDGDLVRKHLSLGLGYAKEDRDRNVRRIGFVAAEVAKHGGIAVCAPIAPYDATRREVRSLVEGGGFLLVYVATPLEVCEARDRKGLYAKAREGLLPAFTGLTDPYEPPGDADLVIDMTSCSSEQAATTILRRLRNDGYLAAMPDGFTGTEGPEHLSV